MRPESVGGRMAALEAAVLDLLGRVQKLEKDLEMERSRRAFLEVAAGLAPRLNPHRPKKRRQAPPPPPVPVVRPAPVAFARPSEEKMVDEEDVVIGRPPVERVEVVARRRTEIEQRHAEWQLRKALYG
jgi:hypothetical protein